MGAAVAASTIAMPWVARAAGTIKVGVVSPASGPLALFGDADGWTIDGVKKLIADGIDTAAGKFNVEIIVKDSQSDPNKASEVAGDLILNDGVHLILPTATTDTITGTMDQSELNECPCISSGAPWQAVIFPRGGDKKSFTWTYHFFWGLGEVLNTYVGIWNSAETNKKVGMLFPQNADGETWGNDDYGLPAPTKKAGYEVTIPGYFQPLTNDFSSQITAFKSAGADIVGGITNPPDIKTFVNQCAQQGYKPKIMTVAAALLFPGSVEAMGDLGDGMTTEVWWTPAFPFKSTLTGEVSRDVADRWEADQKREWTQPIGYQHANWEVVIDILKRSKNPLDRAANRDSMAATKINTLIGPVDFSNGPHKNVSVTPIFGGQWVKGDKWKYDLKIVDNTVSKLIQPEAKLKFLPWA
jgi:branched-chain amino acid transport system substrate-binding protein